MSTFKTIIPQAGRTRCLESRTNTLICLTDSGRGKNSIQGQKSKKIILIATYNIRTMRLVEGLKRELDNIRWDVLGISETRLAGEATMVLHSGHLLFCRNSEVNHHRGGVALLIHRKFKHLVVNCNTVSDRVIYVVLKLNSWYKAQIIQVHALTIAASEEKIKQFYDDLATAKNMDKTKLTVVMATLTPKSARRK
ncbi:craniofacial development protein 2-like [Polyergus mexicanus]|uniref:craniofacial development protein 2-like n=1 Tax=Polyergus mexicanus TaxID=615972 RepID=UPI0038B649BB